VRGVRTLFCPYPRPLSHWVGEGVGAHGSAPCGSPLARVREREVRGADKGTTAWHGISAAGAVFPSASVNGQARCIALTPFVPLSRLAGEGERAAGRTAARSYTPLPRCGRGAGGEGKKWAPPAHSEPKRCTLISSFIPIARPKFTICPPPLGSPRFARGTVRGSRFTPASRGEPCEGRGSPPLREGNRARVEVHPCFARGTVGWGGFLRFARGTKPRARSVPPACRGNLQVEGGSIVPV
jgi:hypothetical protein